MTQIRVILIGDVVGDYGCSLFNKHARALRGDYRADLVIVNGENSAPAGKGITPTQVALLRQAGADLVTSGNHIWDCREIYPYLTQHRDLLRPANFPTDAPGTGMALLSVGACSVAVLNIQGRVFMREHLACPFREAQTALTYLRRYTPLIFVDFHAEATSEKIGLGYFLDGQVTAVVGTHTHVQTADERILPNGTAFITDLGMVGATDSMLGMKKEPIIQRFITQLPTRFQAQSSGPGIVSGVCVTADVATGKAITIERISVVDSNV